MFALRGIAVSLAVLVLAYTLLSLVVAFGWKLAAGARRARMNADFLFGLRMTPLAASVFVTAVFVVPSFLVLEPRSIDEAIGAIPLGLSVGCFALFAAGWFRAAAGLRRTSRIVAGWERDGAVYGLKPGIPVMRVRGTAASVLAVAGIWRPRVLISEAAAEALSEAELQTALRHEVAHVRRWDNLKKLLFRVCAFPGMARLEEAWREASEVAADEAAVSNPGEAVDLAAAVIKLSRLAAPPAAEFSTGLIDSSQVGMRVERLLAWSEKRRRVCFAYAVVPGLGMVVAGMMVYGTLLAQAHAMTEWLVR